VITGAHTVIFSTDVEADRAFFRDVLALPAVDAGNGRLIFALGPAEAGLHESERPSHELYLVCDDIQATVGELEAKGVEFAREVNDTGWGLVTAIRLPSGAELALYEPRHLRP
jgi:predicted enzyme related to lactoylglutathione lyase